VHAELDRLGRAISATPLEDAERALIQERLRTLCAELDGAETEPGAAAEPGATVAGTIQAATADEVIDFIDRQLGTPGAPAGER
jgi:hypothetical protein